MPQIDYLNIFSAFLVRAKTDITKTLYHSYHLDVRDKNKKYHRASCSAVFHTSDIL